MEALRSVETGFLRGVEAELLVAGGVLALLLLIGAAAWFVTQMSAPPSGGRGHPSHERNWRRPQLGFVVERRYDRVDAADQLRTVMAATFFAKPVMGRAEYQVFRAVELEVQQRWRGYRVFAQTALGEVIESKNRDAHSAINSKRTDCLVIRFDGLPVLAIEYQGKGHYQKDAAARDAVKKEALRKAGVAYLEVLEHHSSEEIRRMVSQALARSSAQVNRLNEDGFPAPNPDPNRSPSHPGMPH